MADNLKEAAQGVMDWVGTIKKVYDDARGALSGKKDSPPNSENMWKNVPSESKTATETPSVVTPDIKKTPVPTECAKISVTSLKKDVLIAQLTKEYNELAEIFSQKPEIQSTIILKRDAIITIIQKDLDILKDNVAITSLIETQLNEFKELIDKTIEAKKEATDITSLLLDLKSKLAEPPTGASWESGSPDELSKNQEVKTEVTPAVQTAKQRKDNWIASAAENPLIPKGMAAVIAGFLTALWCFKGDTGWRADMANFLVHPFDSIFGDKNKDGTKKAPIIADINYTPKCWHGELVPNSDGSVNYKNWALLMDINKDGEVGSIKIGPVDYQIVKPILWKVNLPGNNKLPAAKIVSEWKQDFLQFGDTKVSLSRLVDTAGNGKNPPDEYVLKSHYFNYIFDLKIEQV